MNVPILNLPRLHKLIKKELKDAFERVLESSLLILGPEVSEFEREVSRYIGTKFAIGVASGTDALVIALKAVGVKEGDEVITVSHTFVATGEAILRVGATPVFVDIGRDFNINPKEIEKALGKRTKAIIPVHLYGLPSDMSAIMDISRKHGIYIIEDAAQAFGAKFKGKKVGSIGHLGALSFFPSKNLGGLGDGGMITTSDRKFYEKILLLRQHGYTDKTYNSKLLGYNSRLDTLHASFLLVKLKYVDSWNKARRSIAQRYNEELSNIIKTPEEPEGRYHIYHLYTIRVKSRNEVMNRLHRMGVQTRVYYPIPLHRQSIFRKAKVIGKLSETNKASSEVLSLPCDPLQTDEETECVIASVRKAV